jgi:hypothetical protein
MPTYGRAARSAAGIRSGWHHLPTHETGCKPGVKALRVVGTPGLRGGWSRQSGGPITSRASPTLPPDRSAPDGAHGE